MTISVTTPPVDAAVDDESGDDFDPDTGDPPTMDFGFLNMMLDRSGTDEGAQ